MKKIDFAAICKYALYFGMMILFCRAETAHGLKPFGLGFFAALVYARQNLPLVSVMYAAAVLLSDFSVAGAIIAAVPPVIFMTAYFIHAKAQKSMTVTFANLYTLLSQIPYIALSYGDNAFTVFFTVVLTQIFAYTTIIIVYAVLIRGLKYRLTVDEMISGGVFLAASATALCNIEFLNTSPYYAFSAFALLFAAGNFSYAAPVAAAAVSGIGAALYYGTADCIGAAVCLGIAVSMFKNISVYLSAAALVVADIVLGYYFDAYDGYCIARLITVIIGAAAYVVLPKKLKTAAGCFVENASDRQTGKTIINRNRLDISNRLYSVAAVFDDMQNLLLEGVGDAPPAEKSATKLAKDVALGYCAKCPDGKACFSALGTDTSVILEQVVAAAEEKGRATIIDMPPFLTSRCRRLNGLLQTVNDRIESYKACARLSRDLDNGRMLLATQMGGMAEILDNLGNDVKQCVSFDTARERLLIDELIYHNIICKEAIVYGTGAGIGVTVTVREEDAAKAVLPKIASKVMRVKLAREGVPDVLNGAACVHLTPAPKFDFVYGSAMKKRKGETACGDVVSVQKAGGKKVVLAVCDGMGSGENAEKYSNRAITLIENLYRAGFSNETVLTLANKLLTLKNDENYSALSMCVIDLDSGGCDIIKQGAPYSFIKRRDVVEIIEGNSLPIGIIEDAAPSVERKLLFNQDTVVLMSDGITDAVGQDDLKTFAAGYKNPNPETFASDLLRFALKAGASDDSTVLAARIYVKM